MSVMIVGADHLGSIEKNLQAYGFAEIAHVSGRMATDRRKSAISQATSLVVVLVDFVNHMTARNIKEQAKAQGVPLVFAKRSWCSLAEQLNKQGIGKAFCDRITGTSCPIGKRECRRGVNNVGQKN